MPKASKKRKEKAADFKARKAKLKLGKGKAQSNNVVDTSFKARSITLPSQSIAAQKDEAAPRTSRKLTFEDLTSQLKHYNASTRKDALHGLRELLEGYPYLIESRLSSLLATCSRLIGDEDASVRKALLGFFDWLLPKVSPDVLGPHASHLLLFTTSAQTHIFPEIRIDAVRFLDLFLDIIPEHIVEGWDQSQGDATPSHGARVLEGYLGILNAGTRFGEDGNTGPVEATSTASVTLSTASRQAVLKSVAHFLDAAISRSYVAATATAATSFFSAVFQTEDAYESFDSLLRPSAGFSGQQTPSKTWNQTLDDDDLSGCSYVCQVGATDPVACWTLPEIGDAANYVRVIDTGKLKNVATTSDRIARLARTLHPTIISNVLDCAPLVFSINKNGPPESELNLIVHIGQIIRTLYGALLRDQEISTASMQQVPEDLQQILGYLAPYFPFKQQDALSKPSIKVEQAFQELNLVFSEMTAMLIRLRQSPAERTQPRKAIEESQRRSSKRRGGQNGLTGSSLLVAQVCEYVTQLLRGESLSPNSLGRPLTPEMYTKLLPTIWSLLNSTDNGEDFSGSRSRAILLATLDHALKPGGATRRLTVEFVGRLLLLPSVPEYRGAFRIGRSPEEAQRVEEWITYLPRVLWELKGNNLPTTEVPMQVRLRLIVSSIASRLIPYFIMSHPCKGEIPGPFQDLPPYPRCPARRLVLDIVATIVSSGISGDKKLEFAVGKAVAGSEDESYWIHVRTATT
ncbi:hypothetical protein GLOTRDRAFT_31411 [Gloeophyllum trabeum ATCC 11539]|uniref:Pre-rRNA-processing protein n=1 Tax=Gloeophyllum trabeum (strain ATCC 11539 / FP-39264 / Madison 617) TaxID=670483 RepID=S7S070_GLOTA|nr:uncharacterized protein GLOTRDRAFT_31411 [Gloeophyllum trabeum ATCC 11539]EPQ60740.1 hypothetical protein GLOTRDRAFT_31411 [Gloeophyllum trabeum ATCC 11539]